MALWHRNAVGCTAPSWGLAPPIPVFREPGSDLQAAQLAAQTALCHEQGKWCAGRVSQHQMPPRQGCAENPGCPSTSWNTNIFCFLWGWRWGERSLRRTASNLWGMSCCGSTRHRERPATCRLGYCQCQWWTMETKKPTGELQLGSLIRWWAVLMHLQFDSACNSIASLKQKLE